MGPPGLERLGQRLVRPVRWRAAGDPLPLPPLTPRRALLRTCLHILTVLCVALVLQMAVVSSFQQRAEQQRLFDRFRVELAEGTAPVGPLDREGAPLREGAPVSFLEVPAIGLRQVVVSGTSSAALFAGPGHRRDTVLPGQAGATVVLGRRAAYGAPFARLGSLAAGDEIRVTTGQGQFGYRVIGVRREGDPLPAPPGPVESRLVLATADGPAFLPAGVLRVDASLAGAGPATGRLFPPDGLPPAEDLMAGAPGQLWALVLWLQVLLVVSLGAVWLWHRWGRAQAWIVALPPLALVGLSVSEQVARLLPNLL